MSRNNNSSRPLSASKSSRRDVLKVGGTVVAGSILAGMTVPQVHAAEDNTIRLALIGCGGRGSGAVGNAISAAGRPDSGGPVKLVAMADVRESRLTTAHDNLSKRFADHVDVPPERRFVGFDAYRKAIDCLRPGDVALLTTHAGFRPVHLDYAVEKGLNVFMEKTFASDPGGLKRMLRAGEAAEKKRLKIAAGLMCRHSPNRQQLIDKIRAGELGEVPFIRAYRLFRAVGGMPKKLEGESDLLWQAAGGARSSLLWPAAGIMIDMLIHQIDECCWIKDGWPVAVQGLGGWEPRANDGGQNHHAYAMEYTFPDGAIARIDGAAGPNGKTDFVTYLHATRCAAQFSGAVHRSDAHTYKDQRIDKTNITWKATPETKPLHEYEWAVLLDAIRKDRPHNETQRAVYANYAALMGRAAVHMGKVITWEQMLASDFQFVPNIDQLDHDSPPPVKLDAEGRFPTPIPGRWTEI